MKIKKIFVIVIILLSVFLIYLTTMDKKVYYLALGDSIALGDGKKNYSKLIVEYLNEKNLLEEYQPGFMKDDLRITDLIRNIENNQKIAMDQKEKTIKNALIKADLVTISIGNEELFYKMKTEKPNVLYNYIDEMMKDMEKLLKLIREYCKEDILISSYISLTDEMNQYTEYANQKLQNLSKKYEIVYVNLEKIKKEKEVFDHFGLTNYGQEKIASIMLPIIEKRVIQDQK